MEGISKASTAIVSSYNAGCSLHVACPTVRVCGSTNCARLFLSLSLSLALCNISQICFMCPHFESLCESSSAICCCCRYASPPWTLLAVGVCVLVCVCVAAAAGRPGRHVPNPTATRSRCRVPKPVSQPDSN